MLSTLTLLWSHCPNLGSQWQLLWKSSFTYFSCVIAADLDKFKFLLLLRDHARGIYFSTDIKSL